MIRRICLHNIATNECYNALNKKQEKTKQQIFYFDAFAFSVLLTLIPVLSKHP